MIEQVSGRDDKGKGSKSSTPLALCHFANQTGPVTKTGPVWAFNTFC